jgi:hypothetical protein
VDTLPAQRPPVFHIGITESHRWRAAAARSMTDTMDRLSTAIGKQLSQLDDGEPRWYGLEPNTVDQQVHLIAALTQRPAVEDALPGRASNAAEPLTGSEAVRLVPRNVRAAVGV